VIGDWGLVTRIGSVNSTNGFLLTLADHQSPITDS
jgi:hypothetical protein